jgi:hypothetical protein
MPARSAISRVSIAVGAVAVMVSLVVAEMGAGFGRLGPDPIAAQTDPRVVAAVTEPARRVLAPVPVEVVSVSEASGLSRSLEVAAHAAARRAGGTSVTGRSASVGMTRVARGPTVIQAAPDGWQFPMGVTVLPVDAVGRVMGTSVSTVLAQGDVVMGRTTAGLRGATAGDRIVLVSSTGSLVTFRVGLVAEDAVVGGTELLLSDQQADRLGLERNSRVLIWGFRSREAIDQALRDQGLFSRFETRVRRGWDPRDPDGTLGMAATKALLGEFVYRVEPDGAVTLPRAWIDANIAPNGRRSLFDDIPIEAACHRLVRPAIQAALTEIAEEGLAAEIDLDNTNMFGGCFNPRFNRLTGSIGFLSRHAWGMAIDMNTVTNAQGRVPEMSCEVVRIFRKHGFAWGGNFTRPDGMHFEWVGEPRHELAAPSRYCPNRVPLTLVQVTSTERDVLFADDGLLGASHDHGDHGDEPVR